MRKILTAGLAALTLGGAVAATAVPADAATWHGGGGGWHGGGGFRGGGFRGGGWRGGGWGWGGGALAAGVLGLAAGAAIADSHPYYGGPGYYPGYGYGYAGCVGRHRVWDPYVGGYVIRDFRYAC